MFLNYNNIYDNYNKTQIVSLSLAAYEVQKMFNILLQHLRNNNDLNKTKEILSDKDMGESNAFKEFFPHATHLLCPLYVKKNFKDHFKRKPTLEFAKQMIHSQTLEEYQSFKERFYEVEPNDSHHRYFNENWDKIAPKWVDYYRKYLTTFNLDATSRVEGVNGKINPFIARNASMFTFLVGIFKFLEFNYVQKDEIDYYQAIKTTKIINKKVQSSNRSN